MAVSTVDSSTGGSVVVVVVVVGTGGMPTVARPRASFSARWAARVAAP